MHAPAEHPYADFLREVDKPARYTGGEAFEVRKDWDGVLCRVCLAFPDVYDIGMSHLGYKILYKILNDDPRTLAERCYAPWVDMEAELRKRDLPLVSLESARPLSDFDVVGLSLQFELSYTNCLTILDLGRIPLRSRERGDRDPLVLGGGPTATHPEPVAAFFDAFVIGDGEEKLTEVALAWVEARGEGMTRRERLARLARLGGVYVPSLYRIVRDPSTRLLVASGAEGDAPLPVTRAVAVELDRHPFPTDSPMGGPEAIFDRMSIEIARGCTEGCRFCQAGMIYRPVRERDPERVIETVVRAVSESGYDEVSLTSLSTSDYTCLSPLVHRLADRLDQERVALSVSSLRAYGLSDDLFARLGAVRASGLTFAPEAGTQRMRDVVNKNVTEAELHDAAERAFSHGFSRLKLYFMIGLPTETDEDVHGIVATAARTLGAGRRIAKGRAKVTVSVSSHVPKPHTPFQWCRMNTPPELEKKQRILLGDAAAARLELRLHPVNESVLECVLARGDRALADVIEHAWRSGARFDSWADQRKLGLWQAAFDACKVEQAAYLDEIPVGARLPWDHISVGLASGFLEKEHERAKNAAVSPPCGKQYGRRVHARSAEDATADRRALVCYDCGAACDLTRMRERRIEALTRMEALGPFVSPPSSAQSVHRYRLRFEKTGPAALLGHLDLVRAIPRALRRAGLSLSYSKGFHPKPEMSFAPALSLGVASIAEIVDVKLLDSIDPKDAVARATSGSPRGLVFSDAVELGPGDPGIAKILGGARYLAAIDDMDDGELAERIASFLERTEQIVRRVTDKTDKDIDVRPFVTAAGVADPAGRELLRRTGQREAAAVLDVHLALLGSGGVKISEVVQSVAGRPVVPLRAVRAALYAGNGGARIDPLDLCAVRALAQNLANRGPDQ
jgi:radical SAM family uncharacterized protein/radical SAM-linked protein